MKAFNYFLSILFTFLAINNFAYAKNEISLKEFLGEKNIESEKTQIYLLQRCSSIYAFASGVLMKSDSLQSKKLIEISNNLLFKSVELMVIEEQKSLEVSQKHSEDIRKKLFNNYIADGKQNWERNKSYFKGSYIENDMIICSKLTEDK